LPELLEAAGGLIGTLLMRFGGEGRQTSCWNNKRYVKWKQERLTRSAFLTSVDDEAEELLLTVLPPDGAEGTLWATAGESDCSYRMDMAASDCC
jgi:hypothetical protein